MKGVESKEYLTVKWPISANRDCLHRKFPSQQNYCYSSRFCRKNWLPSVNISLFRKICTVVSQNNRGESEFTKNTMYISSASVLCALHHHFRHFVYFSYSGQSCDPTFNQNRDFRGHTPFKFPNINGTDQWTIQKHLSCMKTEHWHSVREFVLSVYRIEAQSSRLHFVQFASKTIPRLRGRRSCRFARSVPWIRSHCQRSFCQNVDGNPMKGDSIWDGGVTSLSSARRKKTFLLGGILNELRRAR